MPEKPRAQPRPDQSEHPATGIARHGESPRGRVAELEELLAHYRTLREKDQKIARSLARNSQRAEQELRRLRDEFDLIQQHGSDLVFRLDQDGKFQDVSAACQSLLGLEPERITGRSLHDFVSENCREPVQRYFQAVCKGRVKDGILVPFVTPDRRRLQLRMHCRAVPHPQTQAMEIIGIARLNPAPPAESAGVLSLEEMAHSLAHELNQPLTAMALAARACVQMTRARETNHGNLVEAITQVSQQAERAGELVRRLRLLGSGGHSPRSAVHPHDLLRAALQFLDGDIKNEGLRTQLQLAENVPTLSVDRIQLEQVLINLVRNAIEAMSATPQDQRVLTISTSCTIEEVVLAVCDAGTGLSPTIADRLFQPYQTTKPQGMGLGLALSRSIVQAHNGRLWAQPNPRRGTTFFVALPIAP